VDRAARTLIVVTATYVAAQMLADIASLRIITLGSWAVDAGTLIYPITFTVRDLIHKAGGVGAARLVIFGAAVINLVMAAFFWVVSVWPPDPNTGPQIEFGQVLAPVWRIVFASIAAEVISELIDTEVYQRWVRAFGGRRQWGRVLTSNGVAVPVDSAVFVVLAFAGVLATAVIWEVFWVNVALKLVVTLLSIPLIYLIRSRPGGLETATEPATSSGAAG
jgi:uncharacterized integral membrane protein (TIGR00697 family)